MSMTNSDEVDTSTQDATAKPIENSMNMKYLLEISKFGTAEFIKESLDKHGSLRLCG